jgi:hypothetical protein
MDNENLSDSDIAKAIAQQSAEAASEKPAEIPDK